MFFKLLCSDSHFNFILNMKLHLFRCSSAIRALSTPALELHRQPNPMLPMLYWQLLYPTGARQVQEAP